MKIWLLWENYKTEYATLAGTFSTKEKGETALATLKKNGTDATLAEMECDDFLTDIFDVSGDYLYSERVYL